MLEWKDFYYCRTKSSFLPGLVSVLCNKARVSLDDTDFEVEHGRDFNPILVRKNAC